MRIGILGQPCIDEIVSPNGTAASDSVRSRSLGGILYSYAAMERLMRDSDRAEDTFLPLTWSSLKDEAILSPLLNKFKHLDRNAGFWPTEALTNRVQLVYQDATHRTEHCSTILPPLSADQLSPDLLSSLDGLFVNMISGFDITLPVLRSALDGARSRPYVHLDIHALVLGNLSPVAEGGYGAERMPRGVKDWRQWLALADSVQLNELELRFIGVPEISMEGDAEPEFLREARNISSRSNLEYVTITRAARGATLYDLISGEQHSSVPKPVTVVEPTGSGDVFGSAFLHSVLRKCRPQEALRQAVAMATWNTTLASIDDILLDDSPYLKTI